MVHPLGTAIVSSRFGDRFHPVMARMRHHDGIDLPCPMRTPVRSLAKGIVIQVANDSGYGRFVIVFHEGGWSTVYAHLSAANVTVGEKIQAGEILGLAGATGIVTGPHLHFELRKQGTPVNPAEILLQPVTGFQVTSVHSIDERVAIIIFLKDEHRCTKL